jgi:hypothetical protein
MLLDGKLANAILPQKENQHVYQAGRVIFVMWKGEEAQEGDEGKIMHLNMRPGWCLSIRYMPRMERLR